MLLKLLVAFLSSGETVWMTVICRASAFAECRGMPRIGMVQARALQKRNQMLGHAIFKRVLFSEQAFDAFDHAFAALFD